MTGTEWYVHPSHAPSILTKFFPLHPILPSPPPPASCSPLIMPHISQPKDDAKADSFTLACCYPLPDSRQGEIPYTKTSIFK